METKNKTIYESLFINKCFFLDAFFVLLGVGLLWASANISIPLWPVPITMQTFTVFIIAFFLGSRKGGLTIALYILLGLAGFSVFSGGKSGTSTVFGPTGGYLIGFLFMAYFVGSMIEKGYGRTKLSVLKCMIVGETVLYGFGLAGLYYSLGNVGPWNLLVLGFFPFIVGDILKIIMAVSIFPKLWKKDQI